MLGLGSAASGRPVGGPPLPAGARVAAPRVRVRRIPHRGARPGDFARCCPTSTRWRRCLRRTLPMARLVRPLAHGRTPHKERSRCVLLGAHRDADGRHADAADSAPRAGRTSRRAGGWKIAVLYAVNTAGAAAGAFLTDFALVPAAGLRGTQFVAVLLNAIAGCGASISLREGQPSGSSPAARETARVAASLNRRPLQLRSPRWSGPVRLCCCPASRPWAWRSSGSAISICSWAVSGPCSRSCWPSCSPASAPASLARRRSRSTVDETGSGLDGGAGAARRGCVHGAGLERASRRSMPAGMPSR